MQKIYFRSIHQAELQKIDKVKRGVWIDVTAPDKAELAQLSKLYGFDADLLDDGVDLYEAPRLEIENGTTYIYVRYSIGDKSETSTEPLLIIVTPEMLVTVARSEAIPIKKIIKNGQIITTQKTKLVLQILTEINNEYRVSINAVTKQIFASRARLKKRIVNDQDIIKFIDLEEDLNEYLAALQPYGILLKGLESGRYFHFHEKDIDLIEDLDLSTSELIELSKSRLKTIQNMRDAYSTITTNNLNRVFKRLTSIAIFLSIFTVVGGIYGMNVTLPFQQSEYAFWIILGIITTWVGVFYLVFKRKNWL